MVFENFQFLPELLASPCFYLIVSQFFKIKFSKKIAIFICISVEGFFFFCILISLNSFHFLFLAFLYLKQTFKKSILLAFSKKQH